MSKANLIFLDIGGGAVKGCVAFKKINYKAFKIFREDYMFNEKLDIKDYRKTVFTHIAKIIKDISHYCNENNLEKPKEVFAFFSSPWVDFEKNIFEEERISAFDVDKKTLEQLIKKTRGESTKEGRIKTGDEITSISLNGYPVNFSNFKKNKIKTIKIENFNFYVDDILVKQLKGLLISNFDNPEIKILTYKSAFLNTTLEVLKPKGDFFLINFLRENFEILLWKNGQVKQIGLIPFSKNKIIRSYISQNEGCSFEEATSLLDLYLKKLLNKDRSKEIKEIIEKESPGIKENINKIFTDYSVNLNKVHSYLSANKLDEILFSELNIFSSENIIKLNNSQLKEAFKIEEDVSLDKQILFELEFIVRKYYNV